MELASLFDDFPIFRYGNGSPRPRRPTRPMLYSVLDSLEDQIGQKVGQVFRILPHLTMELEDMYENSGVGKKRKLRSGSSSQYEPKSKVVVSSDKDNKLKITLDTSNYQPEEITVKVVDDKLAISAKHEAKEKDVYEFYEMYRSFDLPENVDPNAITSHLSASGMLTVEAPLKALPEPKERTIPVEIERKEQQAVEASETTPVETTTETTPVETTTETIPTETTTTTETTPVETTTETIPTETTTEITPTETTTETTPTETTAETTPTETTAETTPTETTTETTPTETEEKNSE